MPRLRLRPVRSSFLLLAALAALAACDAGPDASSPGPDASLCATPPEGACDPGECEAVGGCILYTCDPATGQTVQVVCESPPAAISGPWSLHAQLDGDDPCPEVTRVEDLELHVVPGPFGSTAAILAPDGTLLDTAQVSQGFGQTGVRFTLHPTWTGAEGAEVPARIDLDVTVQSAGNIYGSATATATSGDATCTYAFSIDGERG